MVVRGVRVTACREGGRSFRGSVRSFGPSGRLVSLGTRCLAVVALVVGRERSVSCAGTTGEGLVAGSRAASRQHAVGGSAGD